jgi:hypothetical protein
MFPYLAIISATLGTASIPAITTAAATRRSPESTHHAVAVRGLSSMAQDDSMSDEEEAIPTEQVDKYIAVYSAMQKNHSLGVEQAASKQGLTVDEFRTLEDKIEQNPIVHQRVLDALKASSTGGKPPSAAGSTKVK